jgi:hypothetical protein
VVAGQFVVLENLVTYGPGLEIQNITPGYDLCQIILHLPIDTTKQDIENLFLKQGLPVFDFHVFKIEKVDKSVRASVVTKLHSKRRIVEGLRKTCASSNAIWTSGNISKPALTVTWDTSRRERRTTRSCSSNSPSVAFSTVHQMLCDSQGALMKTCYLFNPELDQEALTLEFDTWENAEITARTIKERGIPSLSCDLHRPYQYTIRIPFAQYEVQRKHWLELTKRKKTQEACIKINIIGQDSVTIQVEGKNRKFIVALKTKVEKLVRGEILEDTYWHSSFASAEDSAEFFQRLTDTAAVHLRCDPDVQALRLYGEPKRIDQARRMIQEEVQQREQVITKTRLTGPSVAFFKREGLGKLQELVGEDEVNLKVTRQNTTIMVRGSGEATHHFKRLLAESFVETPAGTGGCPVCFNEALYPERLRCGHVYCPGCLNNLLTAVVDSRRFPIMCIGNEATCHVPIALPFIRLFLPPHTFKRLLEAAFVSYLEQNPMQFQYCGTSGCRQTYRRQTSNAVVLSCPSCLARTCSSCGVEHDDTSCEEHQLQLRERLFFQLAKSKGYRRCPYCHVLVEKNGGCDNILCRCGRIVSWKDFTTVREEGEQQKM